MCEGRSVLHESRPTPINVAGSFEQREGREDPQGGSGAKIMGKGEMFVCAPSTLSGARRAKRREEERGLDLVCFRLETSSEVKVCSRLSSTRNCNCVARPSNPAQEQFRAGSYARASYLAL